MQINAQYRDAARTAELIFKEIILQDDYRLRALAFSGAQPATILDIGANIGFFAVAARVLFPRADIICLEPCPETFQVLAANTDHLRIWKIPRALSRAPAVTLQRDPWSDGSNRCVPGGEVSAVSLAELVAAAARPYVIKLDCEGGEGSILGDPDSESALAGALHWAMEYHPPLTGISAADFQRELQRIDPRTTGQPGIDGRWIFWSAIPTFTPLGAGPTPEVNK